MIGDCCIDFQFPPAYANQRGIILSFVGYELTCDIACEISSFSRDNEHSSQSDNMFETSYSGIDFNDNSLKKKSDNRE